MEKSATGARVECGAAGQAATCIDPGTAGEDAVHGDPRGPAADFLAAGNPCPVIHAASGAASGHGDGVLAVVLETEGSTYADAGAMVLFTERAQVGWLSGGCLERQLARRAAQAEASGRVEWIEIDTRDDEALLSGSALGCRGRLRIALLPLRALPGVEVVFDAWLAGGVALERTIGADGAVDLQAGGVRGSWRLPIAISEWQVRQPRWRLRLPRLPEVLVLGAGPETPALLRLLCELGWRTGIAERRPRWRGSCDRADVHFDLTPGAALRAAARFDAVLVMHHDFELDREALEALAGTNTGFVGLLGPRERREDLFKLLAPAQRAALSPRLRSPIGLNLGGRGPEAIALSIAAQLQEWRARAGTA